MSPRDRQQVIIDIVSSRPIGTQSALVEELASRGVDVTQATVSRDIKRLGLIKTPDSEGGYRYSPPTAMPSPPAARDAVRVALREFASGIHPVEGMLAIGTGSGRANAVAVAIDEAAIAGVVATLAGDDTILILTGTRADRDRLLQELEALR